MNDFYQCWTGELFCQGRRDAADVRASYLVEPALTNVQICSDNTAGAY